MLNKMCKIREDKMYKIRCLINRAQRERIIRYLYKYTKTFNKLQKIDEIFSNLKNFYKNLIKSLIITTKYAMFKITSLCESYKQKENRTEKYGNNILIRAANSVILRY